MSEQPSLFAEQPPARPTRPAARLSLPARGLTPASRHASVQAALSVQAQAQTDTGRVWRELQAAGERGLTDEALCRLTGIARHEIPARRRPLLGDDEHPVLVVADGTRAEGAGGRLITVWVALEKRA